MARALVLSAIGLTACGGEPVSSGAAAQPEASAEAGEPAVGVEMPEGSAAPLAADEPAAPSVAVIDRGAPPHTLIAAASSAVPWPEEPVGQGARWRASADGGAETGYDLVTVAAGEAQVRVMPHHGAPGSPETTHTITLEPTP